MPFIADRFPTYQDFAGAQLTEIYSERALAAALRLDADELASGVFWNEGDGETFAFAALPRRAQTAPGFGLVATDLDGDGDTDIGMVQNFYSPEIETGRMSGGLGVILENRGRRDLVPVPPATAGLVVHEDAKSAALCDLDDDGRPDLVVGIDDASLRSFGAAGSAERWLRVRVRGPRGNPTAAGARLSLETADGPPQTVEIAAGAGYLSQSGGAVFFGVSHVPEKLTVRWPDGRTTTHTELPRHGAFEVTR
jgi:hypothetical protein